MNIGIIGLGLIGGSLALASKNTPLAAAVMDAILIPLM